MRHNPVTSDIFSEEMQKIEHRRNLKVYPKLTAFRVSYDNGSVDEINMAAGVTLEQATEYFVGKRFEITETTFRTAVKVEELKQVIPLFDFSQVIPLFDFSRE